jgi:hypothetical protein
VDRLAQPGDMGRQQQRKQDCQKTRLHAIVVLGSRGTIIESDLK